MDPTDLDICPPVSVSRRGTAGSYWWKSGYFDVEVGFPRGGYTSEEHVPIKVRILNHSNYGLWIQRICLKQQSTYTIIDKY
jgi:hypothetical protein